MPDLQHGKESRIIPDGDPTGIVKPEGMPGGYIVSAWKRARADVQGNIPPAEKNAVK